MEKYKYTGPTMLIGEHDEFILRSDMSVLAEVNINIATIKAIICLKETLLLTPFEVDVAAKYLEPVKPDTIHFDPKDDVRPDNFFDKLFEQIGKISAEYGYPFPDESCVDDCKKLLRKQWVEKYGEPSEETLDLLHRMAHEQKYDHHEVGGEHYKMAIEPWDYIQANHLGFDEGNIVKYTSRHKQKNGAEDIKKIISYAKHILKTQYGEDDN